MPLASYRDTRLQDRCTRSFAAHHRIADLLDRSPEERIVKGWPLALLPRLLLSDSTSHRLPGWDSFVEAHRGRPSVLFRCLLA
jgi:hypothetical protein